MKTINALFLSLIASFTLSAGAATVRNSWVVNEIYNQNHPYAATASNELATKMQKMRDSAFMFYRGTAHLFMKDMVTLPASANTNANTGYTWLSGDMHIGNFGAQRDSHGNSVFIVDDFDEGYLGQYVWDLRRMAVSMVLAGRENGISDSNISTSIKTFVGAYLDKLADFKGNDSETRYQLDSHNTSGVVEDTIDAADAKSRSDLLSKYTEVVSGTRRFQNKSDLVTVSGSTYSAISNGMSAYLQSIASSKRYASSFYTLKDVHQKLGSGTGSLGRLRYYLLLEGPSSSNSDDVILEMKQEATSAVNYAAPGRLSAADYAYNEGNRVARSAKALSLNADVLVGYTSLGGVPYYLHEKSPYQEDFDVTALTSAGKFDTAAGYLGKALALAHAVSDKDYDAGIVPFSIDKEITDAASTSSLKTEIANFAFAYAEQVQLDWQAFAAAYDQGVPLY